VKDTVTSTTIYLHGTSYKRKHTDTQQESIYLLRYLFLFLCFVLGAACFFVKHVQTGMCISVTSVLQSDESWGNLSFVELSNNCLDPAAQFRFLDNSAMFNLKRKGCFEAASRSGTGYSLPMLYFLLATDSSANCRDQDHAITQTPWGGLYVYYLTGGQTRCAVPKSNPRIKDQGIDPYIALTTNCNDAESKRFNFGKLFLLHAHIWHATII
jgi:hypothetical protein